MKFVLRRGVSGDCETRGCPADEGCRREGRGWGDPSSFLPPPPVEDSHCLLSTYILMLGS